MALDRDQSLVSLRNLPDQPGVASLVFGSNAEEGVVVDLIVQNMGRDGKSSISFTVPREKLATSLEVTGKLVSQWPGVELKSEANIDKLSVLGIGLRTHTGVGQKLFQALAGAGVNVKIISTSEVCISTVLDAGAGEQALRAVQQAFGHR